MITGESPPSTELPHGLDDVFPYKDHPTSCSDVPEVGYERTNIDWVEDSIDATMFLMYLSKQAESRFVPLRAIYWQTRAMAQQVGPLDAPVANYVLVTSSYTYVAPADRDTIDSPNWPRIIKNKTKPAQ